MSAPSAIAALAPDAASVAAAEKLAVPHKWRGLGRAGTLAWGECWGSDVYRVAVDEGVASCSCPSRKRPCKHALALWLLAPSAPEGEAPEWVSLGKRREKAEPRPAADPEARARRAEERDARVDAGLDALDRWLGDLVRNGLAGLEAKPDAFFAQAAARLVDAQARGLAGRVRALAETVGTGPDWPERALWQLGRLALLTEAWRRLDELPPPLVAEVKSQLGFTTRREEVLAGAAVSDAWIVLGQVVEDDERLRAQRTWLLGACTRQIALILQFSAGYAPFEERFTPGAVLDADLVFFPGARRERALVQARREETPWRGPLPGLSVAGLYDALADALANTPWLGRAAFALSGVVPARTDAGWALCDPGGPAVPLAGEPWVLLALSGGRPVDVAGEWNGRGLRPLAILVDGAWEVT